MAIDQIHTYCAMCVSRCGVVATIEDGRFTKVRPDPDHPNGCICVKGAAAPEIVYSSDRIRQPMRRTRPKGDPDPGWVPISWDEAMEKTASRLNEIKEKHGPEAVIFGRATPAGGGTQEFDTWLRRFANAFGSPNYLTTTHMCNWHRMFGAKTTFGTPTPSADYANTNCILLWGFNPQATAPDVAMRISHARSRGAKLIVIDPRDNELARKADCWLRVRPGSDGVLALSMIHVLIEEGLHDEVFVRDWTNGPFLVREDTNELLSGEDLNPTAAKGSFAVWNENADKPEIHRRDAGYAGDDVQPALTGSFSCQLADSSVVPCRTVFDMLRESARGYAPEESSAITWVPAEELRRAVRLFAAERPSCFATWVGLEQHADSAQINRAVSCFYVLTGQIDEPGGNVVFAAAPRRPMAGGNLLSQELRDRRLGMEMHPLGPQDDPGNVQAEKFYDAVLDGRPYPVKAAVMFGGDALVNARSALRGREALKTLEFYLHVDIFANNSAKYADLLLPACTTWEHEAVNVPTPFVLSHGDAPQWSQLRKMVVSPQHDSRSDMEIVFDLAARLGLGEHFFGGDVEAAWNAQLDPAGVTVQTLRDQPLGIRSDARTAYRKYAEIRDQSGEPRGFPTPSGKLELYSTRLAEAGYPPIPEFRDPAERPTSDPDGGPDYSLILTFYRQVQFVNQRHRNIPRLRGRMPEPLLELHPDTATAAGVADGDWMIVESSVGRIRMRAKFNSSLHPRVVCAPYGWWQECRELELPGYDPFGTDSASGNNLVPDRDTDPVSGTAPLRSSMCRVAALNPL